MTAVKHILNRFCLISLWVRVWAWTCVFISCFILIVLSSLALCVCTSSLCSLSRPGCYHAFHLCLVVSPPSFVFLSSHLPIYLFFFCEHLPSIRFQMDSLCMISFLIFWLLRFCSDFVPLSDFCPSSFNPRLKYGPWMLLHFCVHQPDWHWSPARHQSSSICVTLCYRVFKIGWSQKLIDGIVSKRYFFSQFSSITHCTIRKHTPHQGALPQVTQQPHTNCTAGQNSHL